MTKVILAFWFLVLGVINVADYASSHGALNLVCGVLCLAIGIVEIAEGAR